MAFVDDSPFACDFEPDNDAADISGPEVYPYADFREKQAVRERDAVKDAKADACHIVYGAELAQPLSPVEWRCEGLRLAAGAPTLAAGNAFSGKSLAWADVAVATASGGDAWGVYHCAQGTVLNIDFDGQGRRITQDRIQRICRARGVDLASLDTRIGYLRRPGFYLDSPDATELLTRLVDGVALCIVDSWRGATPGTDEWKRGPVQLVGDRLELVSSKTGCAFVIIDHNVKPPRDAASGRSSMHDVHGSTAKAEMAQSHFVFTGEEGEPETHIKHVKERVTGHTIAPFALRFEDVPNGNEPRWGLRVVHTELAQLKKGNGAAELDRIVAQVRACVAEHPGIAGTEAVRKVLGGSANDIRAAVNTLLAEGAIVERTPGKGKGRARSFYLSHMAPVEGK